MNVGYFYAVRGCFKQQQRLDSIANNLANVNTAGFKQDKVKFEDYIINSTHLDYGQGAVRETDRELDVALQGSGFLKVQTKTGVGYTRNGALHLDNQGNLLTGEGYRVMGEGGPIQVGQLTGPIVIDAKGGVTVGGNQVGTLSLVDLADKGKLKSEGASVLVWNGQGQPQEVQALDTEVLQGHLEQSNVSVVYEMANMIETQRAFESFVKAIQSFEEVDTKATTQVGRLRS